MTTSRYSRRSIRGGWSTLEMLIAMVVLTFSLSAGALIMFGNTEFAKDTRSSQSALYKADQGMEVAEGMLHADWATTTAFASTTDDIYSKSLFVTDISPCVKEVTSQLTWSDSPLRPEMTSLTTLVTSPSEVKKLGGDCDTSPPSGGWTAPSTLLSRDLSKKPGDNPSVNSSAGTPGTDIKVHAGIIYMTALSSSKDNFFILDGKNILSGVIPPILGSLSVGSGFNALAIAYDSTTGKTYAYAAENDNTNQLRVIDVSDPVHPSVVASKTLPNITFTCSPASKPCLAGQSIFYYNGKVYLGTQYISNLALPATKNNELHVYCVAPDPTIPSCALSSPTNPIWLGSANVDHNVNAIIVRGNYAYLATSNDSGELMVYNVSNPTNMVLAGSFDAQRDAGDTEDGTSLFLLGNKLYMGRQRASNTNERDFYILDVTNPAIPTELGSKNLSLNSGASVTGILVTGTYAFLTISDPNFGFGVLNVSHPASIGAVSSYNYAQNSGGIDYENGFIYTSNTSNDALRIIRPAQCSDKIDDDGDGKVDVADPDCHTDGNANNTASYNPEDDSE